MMKFVLLSSAIASATAFAPMSVNTVNTALRSTEEQEQEVPVAEEQAFVEPVEVAPVIAPINGWVPDESLPCYGLPGVVAPTGFFDPIGFSRAGITLNEVKRNREAEVMHGRVAMLACVGYLSGEAVSGPFKMVGPANDQLQQVPLPVFALMTVGIAAAELRRAQIGWVEPNLGSWTSTLWKLRENYYPGDVGFDPLGLKPTDPKAFKNMQTRELQNGRLAMLGAAGMCAQELVNHRTIFETFDYYSKVYGGENPYATCGEGLIC
mmetsp:Transcript_19121/g.39295  ORF Transcript_19121/g.39295 Transcript_19121/m.39295 type:complete len:265 (-) Transcript_19121:78-872(-)